jgi:hypothetical protein
MDIVGTVFEVFYYGMLLIVSNNKMHTFEVAETA